MKQHRRASVYVVALINGPRFIGPRGRVPDSQASSFFDSPARFGWIAVDTPRWLSRASVR
jgi:hypothetical protein